MKESALTVCLIFLLRYYPAWCRDAYRFYVSEQDDRYECGVEIPYEIKLPEDSRLSIKRLYVGDYAVLTENRYSCADSYPGVDGASMMHFYDRRCEPAQPRDTLKISLETALCSFEKEGIGGYAYYGYKAYDQMIAYLSDEAFPDPGLCGYHLRSLLDARHAAYVYLEDCANDDILSGENRSKLMPAAEIFRDMADRMQEAAPYRDLYLDLGNESVTKNFRKKVVAALEMSKKARKTCAVLLQSYWRIGIKKTGRSMVCLFSF